MPDSDKTLTSYLLGELSPDEQATLEKTYFGDAQVFDQLLQSENELVDRYVRGRLSDVERQKFESFYLTHPERRERVKFAEALLNRIDGVDVAAGKASDAVTSVSAWQKFFRGFGGQRPMLSFALALGCLFLVVGAIWFFITNSRSRELAQSQADQERRTRELQQQTAANSNGANQPIPEVRSGLPSPPDTSKTTPTPPSRTTPPFVSFALTVGGVRSGDTGKTPTLMIPSGTEEAHLQLNLKNNDYARYSVSLQAVDGGEIFVRQNVKPKVNRSGASFTFVVSANKFNSGDYILTLRGFNQDGEIDDLSKSLFRVEKR